MGSLLDRSIYLASRSPRRRELLAQFGVPFHRLMFRSDARNEVNEDPRDGEPPRDYVLRVAKEKALTGWTRVLQRRLPRAPVLAADTTVTIDARILGKPADRADAEQMLAALSGRQHEVLTAVALAFEDRLETELSASQVTFRPLSAQEIRDYVATGEPEDKAGAYAIQGRAAMFVSEIRGSHSGIVGLPLFETARLLQTLGQLHDRRNPH
jgi:septum formation protein